MTCSAAGVQQWQRVACMLESSALRTTILPSPMHGPPPPPPPTPSLQVLVLLPQRNLALRLVTRLLALAVKETRTDTIQNKQRFLEEFGGAGGRAGGWAG